MANKTVWILGAGFSKCLGAPLLAEMFSHESRQRIVELYAKSDPRIEKSLRHATPVVKIYRGGCHGLSHIPAEERIARYWEHAEEFVEQLDLASQFGLRLGCGSDPEHRGAFVEALS